MRTVLEIKLYSTAIYSEIPDSDSFHNLISDIYFMHAIKI